MSGATLLPQARLLRAMLESVQPHLKRLALDVGQGAQTVKLLGGSDHGALLAAGCECIDAVQALAAAIGSLDDAITGLETAATAEAHPGATDDEFMAILDARPS